MAEYVKSCHWIIVAVPLDKMNAALVAETRWQSLILAIGLAFLFGAVMLVFRFVVTRRLAAMASHFETVREASVISPKTSGTMAHLWATTLPTPPAPMIRTRFI